eukprot:TRINITY_DN8129_c0_g1_i1.p1 TRINITY_DN8129_c0_g1~~TRINITY_DN8129_c0_g1_i1.p1  ORF type:complete len:221 (+),score=108.53 TRINITY_DN8129_c0_g1_i1:72-734(+)
MAKIHVCNVLVLDNPAEFLSKLEFEITFECLEDLQEDLEWKIIYVGSAESEEYDQVLDTVYVGPVPEGRHKFVFTADPPTPDQIPVSDVVGVTVILITCSYRSQEFIRVGYYVNNSYADDPELMEEPPSAPLFDKLKRNILATNPRVTKFKINWDSSQANPSDNTENQAPPCLNQQLPAKDPNLDSPLKSGLMNENSGSSFHPNNTTSNTAISMGSMECD